MCSEVGAEYINIWCWSVMIPTICMPPWRLYEKCQRGGGMMCKLGDELDHFPKLPHNARDRIWAFVRPGPFALAPN
jgi:hypothetical protein